MNKNFAMHKIEPIRLASGNTFNVTFESGLSCFHRAQANSNIVENKLDNGTIAQCAGEHACEYMCYSADSSQIALWFLFHYRTLEPAEIQNAVVYKLPQGSNGEWKTPSWRHEYNCGRKYQPSYNLAPTDIAPVLVSAKHFDDDADDGDRIVMPMMWGMIPFWHKGVDYRNHGLTTNNCRLETMLQSKMYKQAFAQGQRCVIVAEGFYEWQTTDPKATKASERAAYYAYMPQRDGIKIESRDTWADVASQLNLLKMAGLFDIWTNDHGDRIYSYSVITFESDEKFSWLHHRSPAILETDEQVADWLDFQRVTDSKHLIGLLRPAKELQWHRVSNIVNNARNKTEQCNKRFSGGDSTSKPKSTMLDTWLIHKKRESDEKSESSKKFKNQWERRPRLPLSHPDKANTIFKKQPIGRWPKHKVSAQSVIKIQYLLINKRGIYGYNFCVK